MNQHSFFIPTERYPTNSSYISVNESSHMSSLNVPQNTVISTFWHGPQVPLPLINDNVPRPRSPMHEIVTCQKDIQKKRKPLKRMHQNKPAEVITPEQHHLSIKDSPSYFLGLFIDTDVINWLMGEANHHNTNVRSFIPVTEDEMRCFIAILFLSGYVDVPRRRMLWERSPDTHCPLVSDAMQRDRFESIFTAIHSKKDQANVAQIQPFVDLLNEKFVCHAPSDDQHSIAQCTESIFSKHHNAKSPGKSLNVWCACTRIGYCTWFNPIMLLNSNEISLDSQVVILHYVTYIKRFQSLNNLLVENRCLDMPLMCELRKLGIQSTSADRERSSCLLNPPLGGVDRLDCNLSLYRTSMHGKKSYYSAVLTFCLDLALNNAWQLYKTTTLNKKPLDLLGFRRNIVIYYLQHYAKPILSRKGGRPAKLKPHGKRPPPSDARYDGIRHYVIPQEKQTRCAKCSAKTTTRCQKCDIGVHVKCFVEFHTRPRQLEADKQ